MDDTDSSSEPNKARKIIRRLFNISTFVSISIALPFIVSVLGTLLTQLVLFNWHPEDLRVFYRLDNANEIGKDALTVSFIFHNLGRQSALVENISLIELKGDENTNLNDCDNIWHTYFAESYHHVPHEEAGIKLQEFLLRRSEFICGALRRCRSGTPSGVR
jgi:hypothetical protein